MSSWTSPSRGFEVEGLVPKARCLTVLQEVGCSLFEESELRRVKSSRISASAGREIELTEHALSLNSASS